MGSLQGLPSTQYSTSISRDVEVDFSKSLIYSLLSPSRNGRMDIYVKNDSWHDDVLCFDLKYNNETVMNGSSLGLKFKDDRILFSEGIKINSVSFTSINTTYSMPWGDEDLRPDIYNQIRLNLTQRDDPNSSYSFIVRYYNEGLAFKYLVEDATNRTSIILKRDMSSYRFEENHKCLVQYSNEKPYIIRNISEMGTKCTTPFTIEVKQGIVLSLHEAHVDGFCRSFVSKGAGINQINTSLHTGVDLNIPFQTPWRTIILGKEMGDLASNGHIHQALCPDTEINDTSWIVAGKAFRDCSLTTSGSKAIIDFCVNNSLQYVHLDAGWYGSEWSNSDPRTVSAPGLNLTEVIRYGKENGIGVILYVNIRAFSYGARNILDTYNGWGIKGIKLGFVDGLSKGGIGQIHDIVELAAERKMIVNIHDNYRPTGMSRTYPNLLTQEGVRGNEQFPLGEENTFLHYTRAVAGPMDYTPILARKEARTTLVHQLSIPFILYSPLTYTYWYQTPAKLNGSAGLEAWALLPSSWNQTIHLEGSPGSHTTIARRIKNTWVLASMNGKEERSVSMSLDFLVQGIQYNATIYRDRNGSISKIFHSVNSSTQICEEMVSRGGVLIFFRAANESDMSSLVPYPSWLKGLNGITLKEGREYRFEFLVMNGWTVSNFSIVPFSDRIDIGELTGDLFFKPNYQDIGNRSFMISVNTSDGSSFSTNVSFQIIQTNEPPKIETIPPNTAIEDVLYSVFLEAVDTDPEDSEFIWSLETDAGFLKIVDDPYRIEGIPLNKDIGTYWINLSVTDGHDGYDRINFTLEVINTNDPPNITLIPKLNATEEVLYKMELTAFDPDPTNDDLIWDLVTEASFLKIDTINGTLQGIPDDPDVGEYNVEIMVADNYGASDYISFILNVMAVNDIPVIMDVDLPDIPEDLPFGFQMTAFDPDDDSFEWSMDTDAPFLKIDKSSGLIYGIPGDMDGGSYWIELAVKDPQGGTGDLFLTLNVTGINDLPSIIDEEIPHAIEHQPYDHTLTIYDPDQGWLNEFNWFLEGPSFLSIGKNNGRLEGTPGNQDVGMHTISVRVTDDQGGVIRKQFVLDVENTNDPPVIITCSYDDLIALEDEFLLIGMEAEDPDTSSDVLSWSIIEGPERMIVDEYLGTVEWLPYNDDVGRHRVTILVQDGNGGYDVMEINVTVINSNDPPVIHSEILPPAFEDEEYIFHLNGSDPDPSEDIIRWSMNKGSLSFLHLDPVTGVISGTPEQEDVGVKQIEITLSDGKGGSVIRKFMLTINEVNDPPLARSSTIELIILEDHAEYLDLSELFQDPDDLILSYHMNVNDHLAVYISGDHLNLEPEMNWHGTAVICLVASDRESDANLSIWVHVLPVNDPPRIKSISAVEDEEGRSYYFTSKVEDPDKEQNMSFVWTSNKDGILGHDRELDTRLSPGLHKITLTIRDGEGSSVSSTMDLEVQEMDDEKIGNFKVNLGMVILICSILALMTLIVGLTVTILRSRSGEG